VLALAPGTLAHAHQPPGYYHAVTADEERLVWAVVAKPAFVRHWLGLPPLEGEAAARPLDEAERERVGPALRAALATRLGVRVDGIGIEPALRGVTGTIFEDEQGWTVDFERIELAFGLKGRPRTIELAWTGYDAPPGLPVDEVDMEVAAFGVTDYVALRAREPGYTVHVPRPEGRAVRYEPPRARPVPPRQVPAASLGALAVLLACAWVFWRGGMGPRLFAVTALSCAVVAVLLWGVVRVDLPAAGEPAWERPGAEEAGRIFESLHRNIYRAFDYDTEEAIYSTLAHSVRGDLLDQVYAEVYESLIQRDQGGAVSRVTRTEILEQAVRFPDDPDDDSFSVRCRWRVHGRVGHYGHTHLRVNEAEADYRVTREGDRWAIASVAVLDRRRVDDGTQR
jgi:hypothetical protein